MTKKGLGRSLKSLSQTTKSPDLSGFISNNDSYVYGDSGSAKAAVFWMILGSFAFGTMNAIIKKTEDFDINVSTIVLVRSSVIAGIVFLWALYYARPLKIVNRKKMFLRCFTGLTAMFCYFYSLQRIPITQAVSLQYTAPLFVAIFSGKILKEKVTPSVMICVLISFFGVSLIVSPEFGKVEPDALFALASGLGAGLAYIFVRDLRSTDSPAGVVFWFAMFSILVSAPFAIRETIFLSLNELLLLISVGLGAGIGQIGITLAYQQANAAWISAFSYTIVLVASFYGWYYFDEVLKFDDYLGALLIVTTGIFLILISPKEKIN